MMAPMEGTRAFSLLLDILHLKHFWVLMMVSWNLPHGSDVHRDGRWYQMKAANTRYYETQSPKTALLFQENVADMHEELVRQGVQFPGEEDRDVEVWNYTQTRVQERRVFGPAFREFLISLMAPQQNQTNPRHDLWTRAPTFLICVFLVHVFGCT